MFVLTLTATTRIIFTWTLGTTTSILGVGGGGLMGFSSFMTSSGTGVETGCDYGIVQSNMPM
jgi:hypothetical protein